MVGDEWEYCQERDGRQHVGRIDEFIQQKKMNFWKSGFCHQGKVIAQN